MSCLNCQNDLFTEKQVSFKFTVIYADIVSVDEDSI